jgi:hypothetical protein
MTRPVQPIGTFGTIAVKKVRERTFHASTRFRAYNGGYIRFSATGATGTRRSGRGDDASEEDEQDDDGRGAVHGPVWSWEGPEPAYEQSRQDGAHSTGVREEP